MISELNDMYNLDEFPVLESNEENINIQTLSHQEINDIQSESELSEISELSVITLNGNEYIVERIKHNINRPRINYGEYIGALAFDIVWSDETETREPIQNLINKETQELNDFIIPIIDDYKNTARNYPNRNRCCIMCVHKAQRGIIMCRKHQSIYSFLI